MAKKKLTQEEKDAKLIAEIENMGFDAGFTDDHDLHILMQQNFQAFYDHQPQDGDDYVILIRPDKHHILPEEMIGLLDYRYNYSDDIYKLITDYIENW